MRGVRYALGVLVALLSFVTAAGAQTKIVAIGASNTVGFGAGIGQSFPSQLEGMLKARGYKVQVINAGMLGDTTRGMLARVDSSVPADARIVILQPGGNDARFGISKEERAANIRTIVARLSKRGVHVIVADDLQGLLAKNSVDGIHFNAAAHAIIAKQLYPRVVDALGGAPPAGVTAAAAPAAGASPTPASAKPAPAGAGTAR
jgi:acyl-CoA thioesterase I